MIPSFSRSRAMGGRPQMRQGSRGLCTKLSTDGQLGGMVSGEWSLLTTHHSPVESIDVLENRLAVRNQRFILEVSGAAIATEALQDLQAGSHLAEDLLGLRSLLGIAILG